MCLSNGKFYIGASIDVERRWKEHKSTLRRNAHHSKRMQNAWNKYGEQNFSWEILEECDVDSLSSVEQSWIDKTRCCDKNIGFNISEFSEFKLWTSKRQSKDFVVTHPSGYEEYVTNMSEFCRLNNLNQGAMIAVARHKTNHHKSFQCRYSYMSFEEWQLKRKSIITENKNKKRPMSRKKPSSYRIITPDGSEILITSLSKFCLENDLSQGNMTEVANGNRKQHKGYICYFAPNSTK